MHMPPPSPEETARAIEIGHEPSTVSIKGLAWFFVVFFSFAAIVHVLIWIMYREMVKYEESQNVQRSVLEGRRKTAARAAASAHPRSSRAHRARRRGADARPKQSRVLSPRVDHG
jgi:hypothetical protein